MTKAERDQLVKDNIGMVFRLATHFAAQRGPQVDSGDYVTAAYLAMVASADRYETGVGCTFEQFARFRVYGAMMDQLRLEVGKTENRRRKMHYASREFRNIGREHGEFARVDSADLVDHLSHMVPDDRAESIVRLRAAGLNNREIADRLGLSESRVSQLFHRVIRPHSQCLLDA